jgi:hypothetical protein
MRGGQRRGEDSRLAAFERSRLGRGPGRAACRGIGRLGVRRRQGGLREERRRDVRGAEERSDDQGNVPCNEPERDLPGKPGTTEPPTRGVNEYGPLRWG